MILLEKERKKERRRKRRYVFHAKWLPLRSCIYAFINIRQFESTGEEEEEEKRDLLLAEEISVEKYGTVVLRLLLAGSEGLGGYPRPRYIGRAV